MTLPKSQISLYEQALQRLEELDRRLALAAAVVEDAHPDAAAVAGSILAYVTRRFPTHDPIETYVRRARALTVLQDRFDADPRPETLGDPGAPIDRDAYNLSLLLSVAFTNHRFEIMQQMTRFLESCKAPSGRIASIGTGSGYELGRMATLLPPGWQIESYDIDPALQVEARAFLEYFGITRPVGWGKEFPLENPPEQFRNRYDAIVMCELLEHLPDPGRALVAARDCLTPNGRIFATMAINIAQEDHIYLYPDIASCRTQIWEAGLKSVSEWITPQTTLRPAADREANFRKGNYIGVLAAR